jgi:hypothetical protein
MVDLTRMLAQLQAERHCAQKELKHFNEAIGAIERLVANSVRPERRMKPKSGRSLSAAARRKIARAQKARWAKLRQGKAARS